MSATVNPGTITSLHICTARRTAMQKVTTVRALEDQGLEGDLHAQRSGSPRQVLLMDEETLTAFELPSGIVKENITTRGIDLKNLAPGTRLRMGEALFEVTIACTPCKRMDEIRDGLRAALEGQRGMFVRVLQGGTLAVGDSIRID